MSLSQSFPRDAAEVSSPRYFKKYLIKLPHHSCRCFVFVTTPISVRYYLVGLFFCYCLCPQECEFLREQALLLWFVTPRAACTKDSAAASGKRDAPPGWTGLCCPLLGMGRTARDATRRPVPGLRGKGPREGEKQRWERENTHKYALS